jgi:integrase
MPWVPDEFSSAYRWRVTRTGLPYISFKAVGRATYSTLMASAGVPVQVIQRLLGHSSMTTTMKHYVRILDDAKAQAAQLFGESLEAARRRRLS